ncbi:MAG: hypothetical protein M3O09_17750 [Acidobacteriota bacterium]|nr:hypothetical protein [Acidobacteriota bacterium]
MSPRLIKIGSIALVVVPIIIGAVMGLWPDQELAKRTATAPAQIIDAESIQFSEGGSLIGRNRRVDRTGYLVRYRFRAGNEWAEGVSPKNWWYKPNEKCRVCFDPSNPKNNDLRDASSGAACGSKFFTR